MEIGKIFSVLGVCLKATWKSGGHMNIKCVGCEHRDGNGGEHSENKIKHEKGTGV